MSMNANRIASLLAAVQAELDAYAAEGFDVDNDPALERERKVRDGLRNRYRALTGERV